MKRKVQMSVLPGQPTDGTGRVCIHLFVQDERGPFVEPHVLHPAIKDGEVQNQQLTAKPTRGRLACNPRKLVAPVIRSGITTVTCRTSEAQAVTCPKCMVSAEYAEAMAGTVGMVE